MIGIRSELLVALGGNLPFDGNTPRETLLAALDAIEASGLIVQSVSRFYRTPCFPAGAGPDYVNAAVALSGGMSAHESLSILHEIETNFGRERKQRWGMRTLDLDLLAFGSEILPDRATYEQWAALDPEVQAKAVPDALILPHPRLQDRGFVLVPLADVAPNWRHPVLGLTVLEMLNRLDPADLAEIEPI